MSAHDQAIIDAALRTHFDLFLMRCFQTLNPGATYLPGPHIKAIAHQLERIRSGECVRLIINMPPRYLKSITASVAFPAFFLGHDPGRRIFGISYGGDLSSKHASDFQSIVHAPWYRRLFPLMQISRSADNDVFTTQHGFRRSLSVNGAITGFGGDCFIIDDPRKPVDAQSETLRNNTNNWFSNTLLSRLDNKQTGSIIVVMQRVHLDDLTGYLTEHSDEWTVLSLPAIAEVAERISIGGGRFFDRGPGEALHPAYESVEVLKRLQGTP